MYRSGEADRISTRVLASSGDIAAYGMPIDTLLGNRYHCGIELTYRIYDMAHLEVVEAGMYSWFQYMPIGEQLSKD